MTPALLSSALGAALPTGFTPSTTAVAGNVYLTALVGLVPLATFFVLMGALKVKTHWCSLIALAVSMVIAVAFGMPVGLTAMAATQGAVFGLVPIVYIIVAAVWLYNLTETSGRSADLKAIFNVIGKGDQRAQALIIAFSFCGLMEGLAGFGAPVAITCALLVNLGLPKIKAAVATIVGNAINVGFGAMSIPVTTAAKLGGEDAVEVATRMGHLTWILATFIPLLLLQIIDGMRGIRQLWPLALAIGAATGAGHFVVSIGSYELTAVAASLLGLATGYVFLLVWSPTTPEEFRTSVAEEDKPDTSRVALALLPYVLVVIVIAVTKLWKLGVDLPALLKAQDVPIRWPGVYGQLLTADGKASESATGTGAPGTGGAATGAAPSSAHSGSARPGGSSSLASTGAPAAAAATALALVASGGVLAHRRRK